MLFRNDFRISWSPHVRYGLERLAEVVRAVLLVWKRESPKTRSFEVTAIDPCGEFLFVRFVANDSSDCPCRELAAWFRRHDLDCSPIDRAGRPIEHQDVPHPRAAG